MVNSRNKGANFERAIAKALFDELGITFKRDLRQYQEASHGDLIADDIGWPYLLELKRYKTGPIGGTDKWWLQTVVASTRAKKDPVLIYKYDFQPVRCVLVMHGVKADVSFADFCYLARERLAGGNEGTE